MQSKFLIVGGGNLGSRHLQGLAKISEPAIIDVIDPKRGALDLCAERLAETTNQQTSRHKVSYHTDISTLRTNYDLGINATTSGLRLDSLRLTADKANCWILEKILSQNAADLDEIISVTEHCEKVWVNYMMRELTWLQDLKHEIGKEKIRTIKLEGMNWSLACNLIHHLDFATWIGNAELLNLDTSKLDQIWYSSKRPGHKEICGQVVARLSNGIEASYKSISNGEPRFTEIQTDKNTWIVDEIGARILLKGKTKFSGIFDRQSSLTTKLAQDFLTGRNHNLPLLSEAAGTHKIFIEAFLEHWRQTVDSNAKSVPIT